MSFAYKYRNFINKDPILDYLYTQTEYKMDNELPDFDEDLLLDNYIKKNKQIFVDKILQKLGSDAIKIGKDAFVMKTKNLKKHFKNHEEFTGNSYSLFTIEYSTIKSLKDNRISTTHSYYNFKNWMYQEECGYVLDNSFVLGRKYTKHNAFNYLVNMPYTFENTKAEADAHFLNLKMCEPNMKNTSDFPWHNAKKLIKKTSFLPTRSDEIIQNFNKLPLPRADNEIFIDFEVLTSVYDTFETFPKPNTKNYLFNIGCVSTGGELSLMATSLDQEKQVFQQLVEYIDSQNGGSVMLIHWTSIEKRIFNEKVVEFGIAPTMEVKWFDLHKYFVETDIYIKDCENFKLKTVSRCLEKYGLIKSKWEGGLFFDGLGAMTGYILYLKKGCENILEEISKYNLIDCRVMIEIYQVLIDISN